jgi:hypothetical protein
MKLSCLDFSELIHYEIFRCDRCSLVDICSFNLNENLKANFTISVICVKSEAFENSCYIIF